MHGSAGPALPSEGDLSNVRGADVAGLLEVLKMPNQGDRHVAQLAKPARVIDPAYRREWARRNPNKLRAYQQRYRAKRGQYVQTRIAVQTAMRIEFLKFLKESEPCMDCGRYDVAHTMEWDHRTGTVRLYSPSTAGSWGAMYAELAKCDLVCCRCHRIRTWTRRAA